MAGTPRQDPGKLSFDKYRLLCLSVASRLTGKEPPTATSSARFSVDSPGPVEILPPVSRGVPGAKAFVITSARLRGGRRAMKGSLIPGRKTDLLTEKSTAGSAAVTSRRSSRGTDLVDSLNAIRGFHRRNLEHYRGTTAHESRRVTGNRHSLKR